MNAAVRRRDGPVGCDDRPHRLRQKRLKGLPCVKANWDMGKIEKRRKPESFPV